MHFRIGILLGDLIEKADKVSGMAVHIGARVIGLAANDAVWVSNTARHLVAGGALLGRDCAGHAMGVLWPLTIPLAVLVIGTRQLGLFILMHDGAHGLLHPNRRVNDWVAHWLCSSSLGEYRPYHLRHHRYV